METQIEQKFTNYYEKWMKTLEKSLPLLHQACSESTNIQLQQVLTAKLTDHHRDYYSTKWAAAEEDVLVFFTSSWLTKLEIAHLWVTGWKPSGVFILIESMRLNNTSTSSFIEFTEDQWRQIMELKMKMKREEERVERDMERLQVSLADKPTLELARLTIREKQKSEPHVQVAVKEILTKLEKALRAADCVRLRTLKGLLEIMSPRQYVEFLAAYSMKMIQLWKNGKELDQTGKE